MGSIFSLGSKKFFRATTGGVNFFLWGQIFFSAPRPTNVESGVDIHVYIYIYIYAFTCMKLKTSPTSKAKLPHRWRWRDWSVQPCLAVAEEHANFKFSTAKVQTVVGRSSCSPISLGISARGFGAPWGARGVPQGYVSLEPGSGIPG